MPASSRVPNLNSANAVDASGDSAPTASSRTQGRRSAAMIQRSRAESAGGLRQVLTMRIGEPPNSWPSASRVRSDEASAACTSSSTISNGFADAVRRMASTMSLITTALLGVGAAASVSGSVRWANTDSRGPGAANWRANERRVRTHGEKGAERACSSPACTTATHRSGPGASRAMARASVVLPMPGSPTNSTIPPSPATAWRHCS